MAIGPSAIYHAEAVALVEKPMKQRNIALPIYARPINDGNAITKTVAQ